MNIDSTYRDRKLYNLSTEFGIIVNGTPGNQSSSNIYSVDNIIYARFQWNGNATTTIANDTITGNFTDFSEKVITLDPTHANPTLNFYLGCTFLMVSSGVSSVIVYYNPSTNEITLEDPIPSAFYNPANTNYKIINPSGVFPKELLLLGSNLYVNLSQDNLNNLFLLKSGPTNLLFVQNVTANWILPIFKVLDKYRLVMFEQDMPSYSNGDIFQIRSANNLIVFSAISNNTTSSIFEFSLLNGGSGYNVNDVVDVVCPGCTLVAQYRVSRVNSTGSIQSLILLNPGNGYAFGIYSLESNGNTSASIKVNSVSPSFQLSGFPLADPNYLLYVPKFSPIATAFFPVLGIVQDFVFFVNPTNQPINIGDWVELMLYSTTSTGLTMPLVSYKQPVCYEVSLTHLILPNQPVFGFDVLPTFFPYLLVELYNTSIPGSNVGVLYSNNPYTEKVTFFCPVGNPKNPLIVSYLIVLSSSQVQTIKWTPTDNFYFRVLLPNGQTLKYNFDLDINEADIILGKVEALATAGFHFWGQLTDRRVSATFSFRLKI